MDINKEVRSYNIVNGPSKDALFDACKYAYHPTSNIVLDFGIAVGYTAPTANPKSVYIAMNIKDIHVTGIEHEDGSGESFNLWGHCQADLSTYQPDGVKWSMYRFRAFYSTRHREGRITFFE